MKSTRLTAAAAFLAATALPIVARAAEGAHEAAAGAHSAAAHVPPTINEGLITAFVTLIVFVVLLIVLTKAAFGPISKGLAEREAKIRRDIQEAERARAAAEAANRDYQNQLSKAGEEVRAILEKAKVDAQAAATRITMQAQQDAEVAKERATKDIEASRAAAVAEIHEYAATLSTNIAEKILKRNLNADDQRDLVRESLNQLGSLN